MAKKRSRDHLAVTLFPFLSILACVIGVLTLMITALAIGQISEEAEDEGATARAEEFLRLQEEAKAGAGQTVQASQQFKEWKTVIDKLDAARSELKRLTKEKSDAEKAATDAKAVQAEADRLAKRTAELDAQLKEVSADNVAMAAELEKQGKERELVVKIRPGGSGVNLKPTFVECGPAGLVIYDGEPARPIAVPAATIATSAPFLKLLDRIADQPDATIVFLVRPKGVTTYNTARTIARTKSAHNGKLPVPGEGRIDLSLFSKVN